MRYLKTINELFDSDELKSQMEIPYLQDAFPLEYYINNKNILKSKNPFLIRLLNDCPYLGELMYKESGNIINLGFSKDMKFDSQNSAFLYFTIEIIKDNITNMFVCNIFAKCVGNNQTLYNEKFNKGLIDFNTLSKTINTTGYEMLTTFNKWTKSMFNYTGNKYYSNIDRPYNINHN